MSIYEKINLPPKRRLSRSVFHELKEDLKAKVSLSGFLNNQYPHLFTKKVIPGKRMVSPLRQGASNPNSFQINVSDDRYTDWGNPYVEERSGDIYSFIMIVEKCKFKEALEKVKRYSKEVNHEL